MSPSIGIGIDNSIRTVKSFNPFVNPDLINEDFTSDPSWTDAGDSSVTGGEIVSNIDGGVGLDASTRTTYASQTEVWADFDWRVDAGFVISTIGQFFFSSGIGVTTLLHAGIGIRNDGGTLKFTGVHRTDAAGNIQTILSSPVFVTEKTFKIGVHFKQATAPAADNGIFQMWMDTLLVVDLSNIDSDTLSPTTVRGGGSSIGVTAVGIIRTDNMRVGSTGYAI